MQHLLPLLLRLLPLLWHQPWLLLLHPLLTLLALLPTRLLTLLLTLPKLLPPSNQPLADSKKPPSGGFFCALSICPLAHSYHTGSSPMTRTHLTPFMRILFGLGILWLAGYLLRRNWMKKTGTISR